MPQRLRITYRKDGPAKYVAHLDVMRTWERAIRRARLPLVYSQGFSPHARIAMAAPLPVGTIGEREQMDIVLSEGVDPVEARERLDAALPGGIAVVELEEVGERLPSLQSAVRAAHYRVSFARDALNVASLRASVDALLAAETLDWEEQRGPGKKPRRYDLRATVIALVVSEDGDRIVLAMHLALEDGKTGRPASLLAALGVEAEPIEVVRTSLVVERPQVALRAWRESGRIEG
ncbi:MAG: TIGR03936 family radical SAM-associated protein [Dehalococcoidia bacterium]